MQIIHKIKHFFLIHAVLVYEIIELGLCVLPAHVLSGQIGLVLGVLHVFNLVFGVAIFEFCLDI